MTPNARPSTCIIPTSASRAGFFATLAYPDESYGMVKLPLLDQDKFVQEQPEVFTPVPGGWGKKGATHVHLKKATKKTLQPAMAAA